MFSLFGGSTKPNSKTANTDTLKPGDLRRRHHTKKEAIHVIQLAAKAGTAQAVSLYFLLSGLNLLFLLCGVVAVYFCYSYYVQLYTTVRFNRIDSPQDITTNESEAGSVEFKAALYQTVANVRRRIDHATSTSTSTSTSATTATS